MKNYNNLLCEYWFPVPIWRSMLQEITDEEEQEAIRYCKKLQSQTPGRIMTNLGGWQSNDLYEKDLLNTPLYKYFNLIKNVLTKCINELDGSIELKITNFWININGKGDLNASHDHPNSVLSGVFYLTKDNSEIIFERPGDANNYFLSSVQSQSNSYLSFKLVSYTPINKMLLVFPGWVRHKVEPLNKDVERISIAFNTDRVL